MSTSYLDVVNEVLSEMNEVLLTSVTFSTAKNIQRHVKEAVNRAYFDVNNPEHKWPWLLASNSSEDISFTANSVGQELTAGIRWYYINPSITEATGDKHNATYGNVDWNSFMIHSFDNSNPDYAEMVERIPYLEMEEWRDFYMERENRDKLNTNTGGQPLRIIKHADNLRFGVSPIPNDISPATYYISYTAWTRPVSLSAYDDTIELPDQFIHVLVSRARYYAWQRKEHPENSQIALSDYKEGLKGMRQQSMDNTPDAVTDSRIRFV